MPSESRSDRRRGQRLDHVVQLRLSAEAHTALHLEANELDSSLSEVARSILTAELARRHPDVFPADLWEPDGS